MEQLSDDDACRVTAAQQCYSGAEHRCLLLCACRLELAGALVASEDSTSGLLLGPHRYAYTLEMAPRQVQQLTSADGISSISKHATVLYYTEQVSCTLKCC
jgi:hypothetical protein